jgi:hypothetical protein
MPKYIILAYANDKGKSLSWLQKENNTIHNYFLSHNEGDVTAIPLLDVNLDKFREGIEKRYDDIIILHFSGHSDGNGVYFADQKAWIEGISGYAREMKDLHFVFLNGCANKSQVEHFHKAGIKAVIATSRKVDDEVASSFSTAFYSALCKHMTLGKAFNQAVNEIKSRSKSINFLASPRHLATSPMPGDDSKEGFPWGIYYNEDFEKVDLWSLPQNDIVPRVRIDDYKPTRELIINVAKYARTYYDSIKATEGEGTIDESIHEEFKGLSKYYLDKFKGEDYELRTLGAKIKDMLPLPVAVRFEQMLRLVAETQRGDQTSTIYTSLINAQFDFYFAMTKLCGVTMLSELYEFFLRREKETNPKDVLITKDQFDIIEQFFHIDETSRKAFDFASMIKSIREVLESNKCELFIQEYLNFKDHFAPNGRIFEAHIEITAIQDKFEGNLIADEHLPAYTRKVEQLLWIVLEKVYFIMRYKLVSVVRIEIIKYRFSPVTYSHNLMVLHSGPETGDKKSGFQAPEPLESKTSHTDSHSVLLFRGLSDPTRVLNITPFIVDVNMLRGNEKLSRLYIFSHFTGNGTVVLESVQDKEHLIEFGFDESKEVEEQMTYVSNDDTLYPTEKRLLAGKLKIIRDQYNDFRAKLSTTKPLNL